MFLETQMDAALDSDRSQIRFMREFLRNFGGVDLIAKEVHSRADLVKFLGHARQDPNVRAVHIVSHGEANKHESGIVLTEDEVVDLDDRDNRNLFAGLACEVLFLSCCQLGRNRDLMRRVLDATGAVGLFSYTRDVDDYQAFITESLFYHLAFGYVRGRRSDLLLREVYEKLKFALDYLGIDRSERSLADPLISAEFSES
jgi:hypothetical protein